MRHEKVIQFPILINRIETKKETERVKIGDAFIGVRQRLYESFRKRADALFNLLDGLCGNRNAQSPVEVSLESAFEREYSSLHDAVDNFFVGSSPEQASAERRRQAAERLAIVAEHLPKPRKRPFWLFGIDTTPGLRPFATKLADRGIVYYPNPAPGNKPIGVGHSYSILAFLPEREAGDAPWVVPLGCERVPTDKTAREVAVEQVAGLLNNEQLPFAGELTVEAVDS
ncbi:MAG: transposase, partial [Shimia sp.]|nr:transposase [Shimia sp.]